MGKIISILLPKGGVGKTTSAVNLAVNFARNNLKTLLIDLDPTATCSLTLGFNETNIYGDIFDVFSYNKSLNSVIHPTEITNLDCIPLLKLSSIEEKRQIRLMSNEYLLRNILKSIKNDYKFILLDCPPYLFGTTNLALIASDSVLIPIKTDEYSLEAIDELFRRIEYVNNLYNKKLNIEGIFITAYERNIKASFKIKTKLFALNSKFMLNKSIPKDANMLNATFKKQPLCLMYPKSRASKAYKELAEEIITRNSGYYEL